jgi:hypothetical protein
MVETFVAIIRAMDSSFIEWKADEAEKDRQRKN